MKTFKCFGALAFILLFGVVFGFYGAGASAAVTPQDKAEDTPACLDCHGTYEDLMAKPPNFTIDDGSKINPHKYVPHDSKSVPDCAYCHEAHPVPPEETVKKPTSIRYCYDACHHQQEFTPCSTCHPNR